MIADQQAMNRLQALRGFLALYVVVFHAKIVLWSGGRLYVSAHPTSTWSPLNWATFAVDMLSSAGYEMVIGFFVLSGFLIRHTVTQRRPADFYLHRAWRIYPPYLASAIFAAAVLAFIATTHPQLLHGQREVNVGMLKAWGELQGFNTIAALRTAAFLPVDQTFVGLNSVYWSLAPEAVFYVIAPIVLRDRARWYYGASAALHLVGLFLPLGVLAYNGYFALGAALHDVAPRIVGRWGRLHVAALACLLLSVIATSQSGMRAVSEGFAAVFTVAMILALMTGRFDGWLSRAMQHVGDYSFSLYLFHFPLLLLCYAGLFDVTGNLVTYGRWYFLALPFVMAGSFGFYLLIERPALRALRSRGARAPVPGLMPRSLPKQPPL
jgi:peptidoglycan/LPS O-acetylase OafA/YrhL